MVGEGQYFCSQANSLEQKGRVHMMTHCWSIILLQQRCPFPIHCHSPSLSRQTKALIFPGSGTSQQGFILCLAPASGKHLGQPTHTILPHTTLQLLTLPRCPSEHHILLPAFAEAGGCKAAEAEHRQQHSEGHISRRSCEQTRLNLQQWP